MVKTRTEVNPTKSRNEHFINEGELCNLTLQHQKEPKQKQRSTRKRSKDGAK